MAKYVPKIVEPILNYRPSDLVEEAVSYGSKLLIAKILYNREYSGTQKADVSGPADAYEHEWTQRDEPGQKNHRFGINSTYSNNKGTQIDNSGYKSEEAITNGCI